MTPPLACPHCHKQISADPPGVLYCGHCGKPYTIPTVQQRARILKKRADDKHVFTLVGGAVFLFYAMPILLMAGYFCFMIVFYVLLFVGVGVGSAVS